MTGTRDLDELLATMSPELQPGRYVFTTVRSVPDGAEPVVVVREAEGTTLVLEREQADRLGLTYAYVAAMITLRVHSSLDAVGLTAAVSQALTDRGIGCNVVAGHFHDHLFVPDERADKALTALHEIAPRPTDSLPTEVDAQLVVGDATDR